MKCVLIVCMLMFANAAHADIESAIGRCLDRVDSDVDAALGSPLKDRILALTRYSDAESQCISDVATHCLMEKDHDGCFAQMLDGLTIHTRRVHSALPPVIEGEGEMQKSYNDWMRKVRNGKALPPHDSCKLPPNYPAVACTAIAAGTALIDARDWQRNLGILRTAKEQAGN